MNRRILAVLISVVLAAAGTAAVMWYVRSADDRATAGKQPKAVLVADKPIPAGTAGRDLRAGGFLRQVRMPAETLPPDTLAQLTADLDQLVVTGPVQRGQLLLRAMFGTPTKNAAGVIVPDGDLAITAKVKANAFGPGSVRPGVKVAIFYTYTPVDDAHRNTISGAGLEKTHGVNSVTRLLLTDVQVLAIGPTTTNGDQPADVGVSGVATTPDGVTITFGLSQTDAERLAHAVALGGELNIGALGDSSNVRPDPGVDNRSLFG
jgi:pilus assembly protein CpaB